MNLFYKTVLLLLSASTMALASDPSTWQVKTGVVGSESYEILLPGSPKVSFERDQMILSVYDGKDAAYMVKAFSPPQQFDAPNKAFAMMLSVNGQPPREILEHKLSSVDGNPMMDLKVINRETGVISEYRYIITDKNLWQIKAVFSDEGKHHFETIKNTFRVNSQG